MKFNKYSLAKISLLLCSSVFMLFVIEFYLSAFICPKYNDRKFFIKTKGGMGDCYTSDCKEHFPLVLNEPLSNRQLYCVFYDFERRKAGYSPGRKEQAALVGDSFVFGEGVKEEDTLGYLLNIEYPQTNFRNFGVMGKDIDGIYETVLQLIKEEKGIKDIIYFYNLNDVLMTDEIASSQKGVFNLQVVRWRMLKQKYPGVNNLLANTGIFRLLKMGFVLHSESQKTIRNYFAMYFGSSNRQRLDETYNFLVEMNSLAKNNGVNFQVVIYPLLYKDIFGRYPFIPIHNLIKRMCQRNNISCIDAYPALEKYYSFKKFIVHPIDHHPNGLANATIVKYLVESDKFKLKGDNRW